MTVQGRAGGHAEIRATHSKTLELERGAEIGAAATCVVGVAARLDECAVARLRGWVRLELAAGGVADSLKARVNPAFRPGDPLVVRRSAAVTRDAVMIDADKAAADLDRALVERLSDTGADLEVTVSELRGEQAPGALVVDHRHPWRTEPPHVSPVEADLSLRSPVGSADARDATSVLEGAGRVVLDADLAGDPEAAELVAGAHDRGHAVLPADGLAPLAATLAVAGVPLATITVLDGHTSRRRARRRVDAGCRVVTGLLAADALRWLEETAADGATRGVLGLDVGGRREQFVPWRAGEPPAVPDARRRSAIAAAGFPEPEEPASAALSPVTVALVHELLAAGASTRDVARVVQDSAPLPRRQAYELVLEIARGEAGTPP